MLQALSDWLYELGLWHFFNTFSWAWPLFEIIHFTGMALLIGTVGIVDLRILGFLKGLPISKLESLLPYGIAGFVMNAVTGIAFIIANPDGAAIFYLDNLSLRIKMLLILLAGINVLIFYVTGIARATASLGPVDDARAGAKVVAATSLVLWVGVIYFGRLIMYNETLLWALGI